MLRVKAESALTNKFHRLVPVDLIAMFPLHVGVSDFVLIKVFFFSFSRLRTNVPCLLIYLFVQDRSRTVVIFFFKVAHNVACFTFFSRLPTMFLA